MTEKHKENPFINKMMVKYKTKKESVSVIGTGGNLVINDEGEEVGNSTTHVVTKKVVDSDQFVKLFTQNIALTFNLKSAGVKAFSVLIWAIQNHSYNKDQVFLNDFIREEFIASQEKTDKPLKLSKSVFYKGLAELEKESIIAKSMIQGCFWINPSFVFNGNRIGPNSACCC